MKSERFATAIIYRRIIIICVFLFSAVANPLLFTFQLSTINYQLSTLSAQVETGIASYYAKRLTGRRTASGERFHHDSLTCAHRTLPFGTMLKVTNLQNNQSVVVKVNDRGPYVRGRIVDLTHRAAHEIDMFHHGVTHVTIEPVESITIPLMPPPIQFKALSMTVEPIVIPDTLKAIWQEQEQEFQKKLLRGKRKLFRSKHNKKR